MKKLFWGAAALSLVVGTQSLAEDGPPGRQLPQALQGVISLGGAGLLPEFFSNDQFGVVQTRIAEMRISNATANAPFGPTTGYEDGGTALVLPVSYMKMRPGGKSYLRFAFAATNSDGNPGLVEIDSNVQRLDVQYMAFPSANTMYSFGAVLDNVSADVVGAGEVARKAFSLRADVLHKLSDHWGVAGRAEFSFGQAEGAFNTPGGLLTREQRDDRFYTQVSFVGQYRNKDLGFVPQGWVMHPVLAAQFQRNFLEEVTDSFGNVGSGVVGKTENYGTVSAKLRLQKETRGNDWVPGVTIGLEHEYVNDLDAYVDESTYGLLGASLSKSINRNTRVDLIYSRHQGLKGNRTHDSLVASLAFVF